MIAYNTQWLDWLAVRTQARKWTNQQLLSPEQWQSVDSRFPAAFYSPNFFIRTGLFVFCWILVCSLLGLLFSNLLTLGDDLTLGVLFLGFSVALAGGLEYFIRQKNYYRAGIDDALLYMGAISLISGLCLLYAHVIGSHAIAFYLLALPVLAAGTVRYTDSLLALLTYGCALVLLFLLLEKVVFLRPFAGMAFAAATYQWSRKSREREEWRYWYACLRMVEGAAIMVFYGSGNFYVVQYLGEFLFPGYQLPLMGVFYLLTVLLPGLYLYRGLQNKDRLLLRLGLLAAAISAVSFKIRFGTEHPEVIVTVIGAFLTAGAYLAIRFLKRPVLGLTYQPDEDEENELYVQTEGIALIHAQSETVVAHAPGDKPGFGGGAFGGGGAGGSY
jgi:hypothetical protein